MSGSTKKFGWTYLFIAVVVALAGFTIFDFQRSEKAETRKEQALEVISFDPAQVSSIEFLGLGESKRLEKTEGQWRVTTPFQDGADQQAVATFLESLKSERILEVVKEGADIEPVKYGLQKPLFTLKLTTAEAVSGTTTDKTTTLNIGSVKAYDGSLYGQIEGEKRVLLLSSAWDVYLSKPARELRDKRVYRGDINAKALSVKIQAAIATGKFALEFKRDEKGAWVSSPDAGNRISERSVDAYVELVKALRAFDFMAIEKSNAKAIASVGLAKPRFQLEILFEGQNKPFTLSFAQPREPDDGNIPTLSSDLGLAVVVYKVAASKIIVQPKQFFDPRAPFEFQVADVAQVKLTLPNANPPLTGVFRKSETNWIGADNTPLDSSKVNGLVEKLSRLEAVRFYDVKSYPLKAASGLEGMNSHIQLLKADGGLLLELAWGKTIIEKADGDKPEATILPVRTNKTKDAVGIAEASITNLELENLKK